LRVVGVGHATPTLCIVRGVPPCAYGALRLPLSDAETVVHGDPIQPVPLVWRVDGESRDIDRPAGVAFSFQISADSVEPIVASRSRNLFSHEDRGPSGTDEPMYVRP
jgi:hypothetical protein